MAGRTAVNRLMKEYKQLTSQGDLDRCPMSEVWRLKCECRSTRWHVHRWYVHPALPNHPARSPRPFFPEPGPVTESDMFTWEALIMGPKDTPFEGGVFSAKLTFVRVSCI